MRLSYIPVMLLVNLFCINSMAAGTGVFEEKGITLIYGDWSQQDWVPEERLVTEKMIVNTAAVFKFWRETLDFPFDYYVIDIFWYDQTGDYLKWNPKGFPHGPEKSLQAIKNAGMDLGLWYCVNGAYVPDNEAWANSRAEKESGYILSQGSYLENLQTVWDKAYQQFGLRFIKLDFADFTLASKEKDAEENIALKDLLAFRRFLRSFRKAHPDVLISFYNHLAYDWRHITSNLDPPTDQIVSPEWITAVDWIYSGDPKPSDWPALRLRRGIEFYQDHQVRRFYWSGVPLDKIDDHGCFIGDGGSYYQIGPQDFRASWLLTLMRGSRKGHLYGDPALLSPDDVLWMKAVYQRIHELFEKGARVEIIGGFPGQGDPYGYRLSYDYNGLICLVNPKWERIRFPLIVDMAVTPRLTCLAADGAIIPVIKTSPGQAVVEIGPNQIVLLGLGDEGQHFLPSMELTPGPWPQDLKPIAVSRMRDNRYTVDEIEADSDIIWLLKFYKNGKRFKVRPEGTIAEYLGIETSGSKTTTPLWDRHIWSGMTYFVVKQNHISGFPTLTLNPPDPELIIKVEAYCVK